MAAPAASGIPDPVRAGIAAGWKVVDASRLERDLTLEADVVIVGTGAGGGMAAEVLADAGLTLVLVEEGPLQTSSDFRMRESDAYPALYQESAARKTRDKAINILQGRCVGGGTTVNWTSSFRTPATTLRWWATKHGLAGFDAADLAPWFERVEARRSIAPWTVPPNAKNAAPAAINAKTSAPDWRGNCTMNWAHCSPPPRSTSPGSSRNSHPPQRISPIAWIT